MCYNALYKILLQCFFKERFNFGHAPLRQNWWGYMEYMKNAGLVAQRGSVYNMNSSKLSILQYPTVTFLSQAVIAQVAEVHSWYDPLIYPVLDYVSITADSLVTFVTWTPPCWEARKCS